MKAIDAAEATAILATARAYGDDVNALLAQGRRDEARQQSVRVKMLLSALPQAPEAGAVTDGDEAKAGAEAARLLAAAETALSALGPAPQTGAGPATSPRGLLAIVAAVLIVASLLLWPRIDDMLRGRAYNAAALDALRSLDEVVAALDRGVSYREYVSLLMDKVRPNMMFFRGKSFATQLRIRSSYTDINHAFLIIDAEVDMWRKAKAADPAFPDEMRLSQVTTNPLAQQMIAQWAEAADDLKKAHTALAGTDADDTGGRSHAETPIVRPPAQGQTVTELQNLTAPGGQRQSGPGTQIQAGQSVVTPVGRRPPPPPPPSDSEFATVPSVFVPPAAMVHLDKGDATLTGRVVDAATGAPLGGAWVGLQADGEHVLAARTQTAADGTYGFDRMGTNINYWILVKASGYQHPLTQEPSSSAPASRARRRSASSAGRDAAA